MEDSKRGSGVGSGASGASTSGNDESSMEGADGTTEVEEDGREWRRVTCRRGRRGGRKVRESRKGGWERQADDGDGAVNLREQIMGNGDSNSNGDSTSADKAPCQHTWGNYNEDEATALPQAAAGAAHGCVGGAAGGRCRGDSARTRNAVTPVSMVVSEAPPGGGGTQGGGEGRFLGPFLA